MDADSYSTVFSLFCFRSQTASRVLRANSPNRPFESRRKRSGSSDVFGPDDTMTCSLRSTVSNEPLRVGLSMAVRAFGPVARDLGYLG